MLTGSREDYIKAVYLKNEANEKITNKDLAIKFDISPASVSEMMKKLIALGHINKDKELGYILNQSTEEEAKLLIKKHRLWEVFFVQKLNLDWADVHKDAEILEHSTSDLIADALNAFLDFPKYCPHGSVIYGNGGIDDLKPLSSLKVGQSGKLIKVTDSKELLAYMDSKNLHLNTELKVIGVESYDGNVEIETSVGQIALSHKAAEALFIGDIQ